MFLSVRHTSIILLPDRNLQIIPTSLCLCSCTFRSTSFSYRPTDLEPEDELRLVLETAIDEPP